MIEHWNYWGTIFWATYKFTYNEKKKFNYGQIGQLLKLPIQHDLDSFKKTVIIIDPVVIWDIDFDLIQTLDCTNICLCCHLLERNRNYI